MHLGLVEDLSKASSLNQLGLAQSLKATFSRLSSREKRHFFIQVAMSYLVGLLDLVGIAVFGTLALIGTGGQVPAFVTAFSESLGLQGPSRSELLMLFAFVAMATFLSKGLLSVLLTGANSKRLAALEKTKVKKYSSLVISDPKSRLNSFAEPEVAHALTVGMSALFTRTLGYLGQAVSEILSVLSIILLLAIYSPLVTVMAAIYFGLVGFLLQGALGLSVEKQSSRHAASQVLSAQYLRESLYLYPELTLSGKLSGYVEKFERARSQALDALAKTLFLTSIPRYAVEAAFMVGAFGLAFFVFSHEELSVAIATFSVFIASGSRIAPSLITMMNAITALRQVLPEVARTLVVLKHIE